MESYRRRAAEEPGTVLLETARAARGLLFAEPVEVLEARRLGDLPELFAGLERAKAAGLWAAGYLSYECGYHWEPTAWGGAGAESTLGAAVEGVGSGLPLAWFGVYREPVRFVPERAAAGGAMEELALGIGPEAFAEKVAAVKGWIEAGDTYQVNLTDRVRGRFAGGAAALFGRMMRAQPVEFGALLRVGERAIVSASPELFFRLRGREITVRPMKGTAARGRDAAEDRSWALALAADEKNRAENVMIVDLLRSDLGRIAEMGSVRVEQLFAVERFPSLLQMTSEIHAVLRPEVDLYGVFGSLFPSGSIVGAPKVRTMQIVRELEGRERGVYTGAIGFVAPDGEAVFSVAIRTAVLDGERLEMGVGAGITYGSDAGEEYAECLLKAEFLREEPFGLIETMRWEQGACGLLERHMARLEASAGYFGWEFERERVRAAVEAEGARLGPGVWRLRMVLEGGAVGFSAERVEDDLAPLRVMMWGEAVDSGDRFLRHKTTRRAVYDQAVRAARERGCVDALFVNERGAVTEGAIHNVFVRHGAVWRTPPLDAGVLPGVYRGLLLETLAGVREEEFGLDELAKADEIWLTNAVRGVRRGVLEGAEPHAMVKI